MHIFDQIQNKKMAILHRKEEKIQAVLGRLPKKYTHEQFLEMFIKLYSKDWGKIKSAYIKQSQDKEPGTVINMPKPEIYLKQILANYLQQADEPKTEEPKKVEVVEKVEDIKPAKIEVEENTIEVKPKKATVKKIKEPADEEVKAVKKPATKTKKVVDKK